MLRASYRLTATQKLEAKRQVRRPCRNRKATRCNRKATCRNRKAMCCNRKATCRNRDPLPHRHRDSARISVRCFVCLLAFRPRAAQAAILTREVQRLKRDEEARPPTPSPGLGLTPPTSAPGVGKPQSRCAVPPQSVGWVSPVLMQMWQQRAQS